MFTKQYCDNVQLNNKKKEFGKLQKYSPAIPKVQRLIFVKTKTKHHSTNLTGKKQLLLQSTFVRCRRILFNHLLQTRL